MKFKFLKIFIFDHVFKSLKLVFIQEYFFKFAVLSAEGNLLEKIILEMQDL